MIDIGWLIGFMGGIVLSISFLPQIKKMWDVRHKGQFKEVSLMWIIISLFGCVLYLAYGFVLMQPGIIILNIVAGISYLLMLWIYLKR